MWRRERTVASPPSEAFDLAAVIDDERTFRAWYDVAAPRVYAYTYGRTGSTSVAEEITQETFLEVVRNPRTFDGRSDPVPWLIGVARHRLARYFRSVRLDERRASDLIREIHLVTDGRPAEHAIEDRDEVAAAMGALTQDQRAALMLRFVDGLSVREVARTIGRTEDATESLIRRARQSFEAAVRGGRRAS
jgi:RNA polymerase sigma-70 factor (ECF subfamily)